jgi:hypothetical protein
MFALASPGDVGGVGKLERASRKGGMLASSCPVPLPGCIDLMPTMMIGTILPSPSSSPSAPPVPDALPPRPVVSFLALSVLVPNLNILKKLRGACAAPGVSPPCPSSLPRSADAMLPFCSDCRKVSNVPSRVAAWLSSPTSEAAVAAAASDSSLDSTSAWSSPCLSCCTLSMFSPSCHSDRLLRGCPIILRSRRCVGIMPRVRPSRRNGLKGTSGRGLCPSGRSTCELVRSSWSKSSPSSGTCTLGRKGPRSLAVCLKAERLGVVLLGRLGAAKPAVSSVLRAGSGGRLDSRPVMEEREERARVSRERERLGTGASSGGDGPASWRPKCEERRLESLVVLERGREGVSGALCSSSGSVSSSGWDAASKPGAHDSGRERRRVCASAAPVECAWPML